MLTSHPGLLPAILVGTLTLLAGLPRRRDAVAGLCLIASVAAGIVPVRLAFSGFAQPVVPTLACLLVLGGAARDGGLLERALLPARQLSGTAARRLLLVAAALAGAFLGRRATAEAIAPSAEQLARRVPEQQIHPPGRLAYAAGLGGLATLVGTVPNLLVSSLREAASGAGFGLFAFAPAGAAAATLGLALLAYRPRRRAAGLPATIAAPLAAELYVSELLVPPGSELVGLSVGVLEARAAQSGIEQDRFAVLAVVRETYRRLAPRPGLVLEASDLLVLATGPDLLQRMLERPDLQIAGAAAASSGGARASIVEAVVSAGSELIGRSPGEASLERRFGVGLVAVGRPGEQAASAAPGHSLERALGVRLRRVKLRAGDLLVLHGAAERIANGLLALGCLKLNERRLQVGRDRLAPVPLLLLAGALLLAWLLQHQLAIPVAATPTPAIARAMSPALAPALPGGAVLALCLIGAVGALIALGITTAEAAYGAINFPLLVTLACLLPVSAALAAGQPLREAAAWLARAVPVLPVWGLMQVALLIGLFGARLLGSAATVLLAGPLALAWAARLGLPADPVLLALALGTSAGLVRARGEPGLQLALLAAIAVAGVPLLLAGAAL